MIWEFFGLRERRFGMRRNHQSYAQRDASKLAHDILRRNLADILPMSGSLY
jgi:hypothetical protein